MNSKRTNLAHRFGRGDRCVANSTNIRLQCYPHSLRRWANGTLFDRSVRRMHGRTDPLYAPTSE